MLRNTATAALAAVLALLCLTGVAGATSLETVGHFEEPIYVTSDPGDGNRLFVVERRGRVIEVAGGGQRVFADLSADVDCGDSGCAGERGLLSIALAPDFASSGRLFADYAGEPDGAIHVVELRAPLGATAVGAVPRQLLEIEHEKINHNGGQLQFGPEGDLFVGTGDGGGSNDELHNAQDLGSLLGKLLRLDPDPSGPRPYTVPAGNPLAGTDPGSDTETIWSWGLRNPFRFSFDRAGSGIWIGDVGQGAREEIDFAPAPGFGGGFNYGWNCFEGTLPGLATDNPQCEDLTPADFTAPVFDYSRGSAPCAAVIGGYVVRDPGLTDLYGRYLYADLCAEGLRSFDPADPAATDRAEPLAVASPYSFGEDACDRLYVVSGDGTVSRLNGARPTACTDGRVPTATSLRPAYAGIRAFSRRVVRGDRALITVWVSPCANRQGERIRLFRGHRPAGSRSLSRACTARFRPRIRQRSNFRARIAEGAGFAEAASRRLTIKPRRARHGKRHRHHRQ